MMKWAHTLGSGGLLALSVAAPAARHVVSAYPAGAIVALLAWAIIGHLSPSPIHAFLDKHK